MSSSDGPALAPPDASRYGALCRCRSDAIDRIHAEDSFDNKINDHPPTAPYPRVQHTAAPAGGIVLRTAIDSFDLNSHGIFVGVHVRANPTALALSGPAIIPNNYATELLHYTLRLPSGTLPADPTLRVAWTLTDAASGALLTSQDDKVDGPSPGFEFQPSSFPSSSAFDIQGRLYQALRHGCRRRGHRNDVTAGARSARAWRAYVNWRAQSVKPQVSFNTINGRWQYGRDAHVRRRSKWRRSEAPCQAASKGVDYAGRYQPQYANTLPFPIKVLNQCRPLLCDYCFFGEPTGTNARF